MTTGYRGGVDEVKGPFTYKIVEVPAGRDAQRTTKFALGPAKVLMQVDAEGNEYLLAVVSPLAAPGEAEMLAKAMNQYSKRREQRGKTAARRHQSG